MPKSLTKPTYVVMLIDAWFPSGKKSRGVYGGGQVHVRDLRAFLQKHHHCKIQLFYAKEPNIFFRFIWMWWVIIQVISYSKNHQIDIIHTHGFITGVSGKILSHLLKKPVIHTVHGSHLMDQNKNNLKTRLEKWLLTEIKYNVQITVGKNFLKYQNINTNIQVIPNGVDLQRFNEITVKKNTEPTIIWVGRNDKVKGIHILKTAIKKVRQKIPNLKAELVTGGRLTGKKLITAYKRSHVFVLPSLAEGQPITLLEAWASKLPVIVTRVGENPNMVKDGVNGYLIDKGNVKQLTDAILKVFRSKTKKAALGLAGYNLVKNEYTWKLVAKKTYAVYQSLLK